VKTVHYMVSWFIRIIMNILCKIDARSLRQLPKRGPCIVVTNHINFLEVPLLYTRLMPRNICALVKAETWNNPLLGFLGNLWNAIPINRGAIDRKALSTAREVLDEGGILVVAPEGTRSGDGRLRRGRPGVVLLALNSGIPVFPLAHYGGETFWRNFRSFRRTPFTVKRGKPFLVEIGKKSCGREQRNVIADEIMRRIAELLPERLKGYYAGLTETGYRYLQGIRNYGYTG